MNDKVLYFSLSDRKESFYNFIKNACICYQEKLSFDLIGENVPFNDPRDLLSIIERERNKDSLHVIIDYVSCCVTGKENNYSSVFRSIIMCYPEVQFLFDETFVRKNPTFQTNGYCFLNFLFWSVQQDLENVVLTEYHQFDLGDFSGPVVLKQFLLLLKGRNNTYDASNLRYAIKQRKFSDLRVVNNYKRLDCSRQHHAAVVVDEEYHQAQFNCYCLYANGFRVFPIVTASELLWINTARPVDYYYNKFLYKELTQFLVLLKNYSVEKVDHFALLMKSEGDKLLTNLDKRKDERKVKERLKHLFESEYKDIQKLKDNCINENDRASNLKSFQERLLELLDQSGLVLIRDYDLQFIDEKLVASNVNTDNGRNEVDYIRGAKKNSNEGYELINDDGGNPLGVNPYWKSFNQKSSFFVSKGDRTLRIGMEYPVSMNVDNKPWLELRGIKKPLEGIYAWAHQIPCVKKRYESSRDTNSFVTSRIGEDGHSLPLDIYGIVRPMVHRAESYFRFEHDYRLAALVAGEAIGILNGFHKSLMNKAYYIQAVAENAMAMSLLGGDEAMLVQDVSIRLKQKVKDEVNRMIEDRKDRYNLLNNIFNDCHLFCLNKEYFKAADQALSVMAHEREGIYIYGWFKKWFKKTNTIESDEIQGQ